MFPGAGKYDPGRGLPCLTTATASPSQVILCLVSQHIDWAAGGSLAGARPLPLQIHFTDEETGSGRGDENTYHTQEPEGTMEAPQNVPQPLPDACPLLCTENLTLWRCRVSGMFQSSHSVCVCVYVRVRVCLCEV